MILRFRFAPGENPLDSLGGEHQSAWVSERFDMNATTLDGAREYFRGRALQLLREGFRPRGDVRELVHDGVAWGAEATVARGGVDYTSVYVYAQARGVGHMSRLVDRIKREHRALITHPDCDLERFFREREVEYLVAGQFALTREYRAVETFYGDRRAKRSGLHTMNHIDEGLAVLAWLEASDKAQRAYCLHPLVQADADLLASYPHLAQATEDPQVLALALEYRNVANAYLSHRTVTGAEEVALSPLAEVNDMLRADKVQNYKDFIRHHRPTHPRAEALDRYFRTWLDRLEIPLERFERLANDLVIDA